MAFAAPRTRTIAVDDAEVDLSIDEIAEIAAHAASAAEDVDVDVDALGLDDLHFIAEAAFAAIREDPETAGGLATAPEPEEISRNLVDEATGEQMRTEEAVNIYV